MAESSAQLSSTVGFRRGKRVKKVAGKMCRSLFRFATSPKRNVATSFLGHAGCQSLFLLTHQVTVKKPEYYDKFVKDLEEWYMNECAKAVDNEDKKNKLVAVNEIIFCMNRQRKMDGQYKDFDISKVCGLQLNLVDLGLRTMPPLYALENLLSLKITKQKITRVTSKDLENLKNLQELDLSLNGINHVAADAFKEQVNLKELNLGDNPLTSIDMAAFSHFSSDCEIFIPIDCQERSPDYMPREARAQSFLDSPEKKSVRDRVMSC